jgi:RNA polymerase subunit RPABC4/transcription elongation factor Spt4
MTARNQTSTRFKDEMRIVPPWVFFLATLIFLTVIVLVATVAGRDHHPPALPLRVLLGVMAGTVAGCYLIVISYINRDAGRRGMSRLLWTLIAVCVPNALGIVLYFVLRKPRTGNCPQCNATVEPGFSFCPRCRNRLQPVCPHCQRSIDLGDKFCPYCGGALESTAVSSVTSTNQP